MEKKKGFFQEFKEFISRGNVLDMAVGVIVATAFGKITTALVNNVIMPFVGWIFGGTDLSMLNITLREAVMNGEEVVKPAIELGIGTFISAIIDFVIIAFVVFAIVKAFNKARELSEKKKKAAEEAAAAAAEEAPAAPPEPSAEEKLLTEIRDLLKAQQK
ncbi:MAG: large conductance mechanosensitive channel protein MscL [Oscillospiraceae bacterium]|nr:large conductance mechanosensitive channel protein MscL [Oscillospiraceae bacterium]